MVFAAHFLSQFSFQQALLLSRECTRVYQTADRHSWRRAGEESGTFSRQIFSSGACGDQTEAKKEPEKVTVFMCCVQRVLWSKRKTLQMTYVDEFPKITRRQCQNTLVWTSAQCFMEHAHILPQTHRGFHISGYKKKEINGSSSRRPEATYALQQADSDTLCCQKYVDTLIFQNHMSCWTWNSRNHRIQCAALKGSIILASGRWWSWSAKVCRAPVLWWSQFILNVLDGFKGLSSSTPNCSRTRVL